MKMVCRAAVKIQLFEANSVKEITIPCHRHCGAFHILHDFGYVKGIDYKEIEQGFLDEHDRFMSRTEAWREAYNNHQLKYENDSTYDNIYSVCKQLFSEDVW
jgi:hypothetical protein